jgi:hypothetical protein
VLYLAAAAAAAPVIQATVLADDMSACLRQPAVQVHITLDLHPAQEQLILTGQPASGQHVVALLSDLQH